MSRTRGKIRDGSKCFLEYSRQISRTDDSSLAYTRTQYSRIRNTNNYVCPIISFLTVATPSIRFREPRTASYEFHMRPLRSTTTSTFRAYIKSTNTAKRLSARILRSPVRELRIRNSGRAALGSLESNRRFRVHTRLKKN